MVRKPLLKNDNRTKLFFYDYLAAEMNNNKAKQSEETP